MSFSAVCRIQINLDEVDSRFILLGHLGALLICQYLILMWWLRPIGLLFCLLIMLDKKFTMSPVRFWCQMTSDLEWFILQEMSRQLYGRHGHDNHAQSYDFEFTSPSASPNFEDDEDFVNDEDFFWKKTLDSGLVCTSIGIKLAVVLVIKLKSHTCELVHIIIQRTINLKLYTCYYWLYLKSPTCTCQNSEDLYICYYCTHFIAKICCIVAPRSHNVAAISFKCQPVNFFFVCPHIRSVLGDF